VVVQGRRWWCRAGGGAGQAVVQGRQAVVQGRQAVVQGRQAVVQGRQAVVQGRRWCRAGGGAGGGSEPTSRLQRQRQAGAQAVVGGESMSRGWLAADAS
jgi:hypothetical protein